jgi:hypothetical protein
MPLIAVLDVAKQTARARCLVKVIVIRAILRV